MHTLIKQDDGPPIVLFKDGTCSSVKYAISNRKAEWKAVLDKGVNIKTQTILNTHGQVFLCLITEGVTLSCMLVELEKENYTIIENSIKVREIARKEQHVSILGYVIIPNSEYSQLMTVWSDGRIYLANVFNNNDKSIGLCISALKSLSISSPLAMLALNNNYVAIYGPDVSQEGASLIIYNIQFKIMQSRQQFKLFSKDAIMFSIGSYILLAAGQGVAVIPYQLAAEQLASIVGTQRVIDDDDVKIVDEMKIVHWTSSKDSNSKEHNLQIPHYVPINIAKTINNAVFEGLPESYIVDLVFPMLLDNLNNNIQTLMWFLSYFKDIKESLVVTLMQYALTLKDGAFEQSNHTNGVTTDYVLYPLGRRKLVNKILQTPISEALILKPLRTKLEFNQTIHLLKYIYYLISNPEDYLTFFKQDCDVDVVITKWCNLLIDSHYQEIILSRDPNVLDLLVNLRKVVKSSIEDLHKLKKSAALMVMLKDGKSLEVNQQCGNSKYYSVESVDFY